MRYASSVLCALLAVAALCGPAVAQTGRFRTVGAATVTNDAVNLIPSSPQVSGAAYLNDRVRVAEGFDTTFTYRFDHQAFGEGFAFVIQNQSADAIGRGVTGLGINGLTSALAITFRPGNGRGVQVYGASGTDTININSPGAFVQQAPSAIVPLVGGESTVRIRYVPGSLDVYLNGVRVISGLGVDLGNLGGRTILGPDGRAWLGFSASGSQFRFGSITVNGLSTITLLPTPGAAALLLAGGVMASRRRR